MFSSDLVITSGRANRQLADLVYDLLKFKSDWVDSEITDFANKEIFVKYLDTLRGKDVFIFQSSNSDPNKDIMELLLLIHTAKLASASRITAVIPYIYGSRQDRKSESRTPITIALMANILKASGADRVVTVSLHSPQSMAAFNGIAIDNISSSPIFDENIKKLIADGDDYVVVSPDIGGVGRASYYSNTNLIPLAFANKYRPQKNEAKITDLVGDVGNKNCIIIDDIIDTAGSLCSLAQLLKDKGAKKIFVYATHLILSKDATSKIMNSSIDKVYGTDSIRQETLPEKFETISLSSLLSDVILRIHEDRSVGVLYEKYVK